MTADNMDTYIREAFGLVGNPRQSGVALPGPGSIVRTELHHVVDDPRALQGWTNPASPDNPPPSTERVWLLYSLARRLDALPPTLVPSDLRSRVARARFLLWTMSLRTANRGDWPAPEIEHQPMNYDRIDEYAWAAREDWLRCLNAWEDDPWLAEQHAANHDEFERQFTWLTETWPGKRSSKALGMGKDATADHTRIAVDLAENYWLPAGTVLRAGRALSPARSDWIERYPLIWLVVVGATAAALLFGFGNIAGAVKLSAAWLVVIAAAALLPPPHYGSLLLLRLPAAVSAGAISLLALTARWWLSPHAWMVGVGMLIAGGAYLILETRMHGAGWRAGPRALLVWLVGASYALVLSLVVLRYVAPQFGENGQCLVGWWETAPFDSFIQSVKPDGTPCAGTTQAAATPAAMLVTMTGWSLAVGIGLQVLWDDRPVTSPLGRLRRVRGGLS